MCIKVANYLSEDPDMVFFLVLFTLDKNTCIIVLALHYEIKYKIQYGKTINKKHYYNIDRIYRT